MFPGAWLVADSGGMAGGDGGAGPGRGRGAQSPALPPARDPGDAAGRLFCRQGEITDALAGLLIATVHRINARAGTKVTGDFVAELQRVPGKENILFKMTEAALGPPGERVEDVIYPAVPGGHETLVALLREYKANGTSWRQRRQRVFKASYTSHYRTGLIQVIEVLESGSAGTVHAPMVEARVGQAVQGGRARAGQVLRARRARPGRRDHPGRAGGADVPGRRQAPPDPAHRVRVRGVPGAAGEAAVQGDLGGRRGEAAQPPALACRPASRTGGPRTMPSSASRWTPGGSPARCGRSWTPGCRR